ncbi:IclR family transcriptional regulator [Bryobacter aggregatus]|uniref:IclR family transcriptional regulator n=1 Tax=Bryobacter aggregatus TaxID=360054 RepID=UPI0009B5C628|nr:IclR family transcriptional regulator [Bryobacter aggregatus]
MENISKATAPALERGLTVLEAVARSRGGLTLSQITRYLDLPKSSAFCLLRTLEQCGYLIRDPKTGKYSVSLRICTVASMALNGIGLREKAKPYLRRLSEESGLTVHMAILENGSCLLIEKMTPAGVPPIATWVGKQLSLHCTAIGKAIGAYMDEEALTTLMREQGFMRHNENTICSMRRLKQELATVRQRGYSMDDEEEEISIRCIGGALFEDGKVVGGLSLVGTTNEIHGGTIQHLASMLVNTATQISELVKLPDLKHSAMSGPLRMKSVPTSRALASA